MRNNRDFAVRFFRSHNVKKIMIAGSEDNIALFKAVLPKEFQQKIVGTFTLSMSASHADVLEKIMQLSRGD